MHAEHLDVTTLHRLLESVEIVHSDAAPETLGSRIECAILRSISSDFVSIDSSSPRESQFSHQWSSGHLEASVPEYMETFLAYFHEHPFFQPAVSCDLRSAVRISDTVSLNQFRRSGLYNEFFKPLRVEHQMVVGVGTNPLTAISVVRTSGDFSLRDRSALQALRRHLGAAIRNSDTMARLRQHEAQSRPERVSILLTPRELEVLGWVEQGLANEDIAVLLRISVRTIHKHLQNAFEKLNVETRTAAVRKMRDALNRR